VEYTRLFDAGAQGTGCSLNGGLQHGPQMKVMEEAVRFYAHFGLTLTEEQKELPDHLTTQLNFLHFLAYGEHLLESRGESAIAYRLARRDFIARHPGRWLPIMEDKLRTMEPLPLFLALTELLQRLLTRDLAQLEARHGKASTKPSGDLPFGGI
jgi:DMSO reductase family type II enzyme chaperone